MLLRAKSLIIKQKVFCCHIKTASYLLIEAYITSQVKLKLYLSDRDIHVISLKTKFYISKKESDSIQVTHRLNVEQVKFFLHI